MAFSGAVMLGDLDDFLTPAQACVKPQIDEAKKRNNTEEKGGRVTIQMDMSDDIGHFNQIETTNNETAAITLADCLACSGCVTSAETVLITQQSTSEFLSHLTPEKKASLKVVVSVSPQSRTAIAEHYNLPPLETAKRLTTFLKQLGVDYVLDTTASLDISLLEARQEFVRRFKEGDSLPVLASECPGWICYAEKTHGEYVLPYISAVKSPQQIMGSIVKTYLAQKLQTLPANLYHCTIMPCYDKKLEASREDFTHEEIQEVDCVLATSELHQLIEERGGLSGVKPSPLDPFNSVNNDQTTLLAPLQTGASGGYAENLFRYSAEVLFKTPINGEIEWVRGRNADIHEATLTIEGRVVLKVARAYGFRNIQNLIRQIKRKKSKYHYVELMACPSGCLNGGGQIKAPSISQQKQLVVRLNELYHTSEARAIESQVAKEVYDNLVKDGVGSQSAAKLFHTTYKAVEKVEIANPLAIKW